MDDSTRSAQLDECKHSIGLYPLPEPAWRFVAEPARPLPPDAELFLEAQVGSDGSMKTRLTYQTALRTFWAHRLTLPRPDVFDVSTLTMFALTGLPQHAPDSRQLYLSVASKYLAFLEAQGRTEIPSVATMQHHLKGSVGRKRFGRRRREATPAVYLVVDTAERLAASEIATAPGSDLKTLIALRNAAVVHVLLSTGARASEIAALTQEDVDLGRATTVRVRGKGNRVRTVRLDEMARVAIQRYLYFRRDRAQGLFVAHSDRSSGIKPASVTGRVIWQIVADLWKATRERFSDRPDFDSIRMSPHVFRHTVADTLAKQGANIHAIRQYLGHRSIATTQIYIDDAGDERVMNEIAAMTPSRTAALRAARRTLHVLGEDDAGPSPTNVASGHPKLADPSE